MAAPGKAAPAARLDRAALAQAIATLSAEPTDLWALAKVARGVAELGGVAAAVEAQSALAHAAAEGGQLMQALSAVKQLEGLDRGAAARLLERLADDYGARSKRVDPAHRVGPPPMGRAKSTAPVASKPAQANPASPANPANPANDATLRKQAETALKPALAAARAVPAAARLPALPLFRALEPDAFASFVELLGARRAQAGSVIVEQGGPAEAFWVIARGRVRIERQQPGAEVVLSRLGPGAFFGEMALLGGTARSARAVAESDVELFEIARGPLEQLAAAEPKLAEVLAAHCRDRLIANLMVTSAVFREIRSEERSRLAERFSRRVVPAGTRVVEEGAEGEGIHVIVTGAVEVRKRDDGGGKLVLSRLGPGDVFGEMSLLGRRPAQASIVAIEKTALLLLPREDFDLVVKDYPQLLGHLYQLQVTRERDNERLLAAEPVEADDYLI
ncbi:MAG: cyclic nucleotide-binding domain-containing protein [Deltaproteobacteria bacterium]|nr:cyclic nucleotide-binding domain-containing protein [Deltaproteobacteria bacterium]